MFRQKIPPSVGQRLIRGLFKGWLRFSCRIGVFDICFPDAEQLRELRGTVLAPNHPSLIDAVILLSIVPRTVCIMRANLIQSPFLGGRRGWPVSFPTTRGPRSSGRAWRKLEAGENLLIFPEGTRTGAQAINPFKNGFALIAKKAGASIQTVFIEREGRYLSKGVSLFARSQLPIRFRLHLGELFSPDPEKPPSSSPRALNFIFASTWKTRARTSAFSSPLESLASTGSGSHLVVLPSYNSGPLLAQTARAVLEHWKPVWIVLDGSTDSSVAEAHDLSRQHAALRLFTLNRNHGKGDATLVAMRAALEAGYSHALVVDADGQHPADRIGSFMQISSNHPEAMVLGVPVFGPDAPPERVKGRRIGNWFANLETLWGGVHDSLFGFRLYPLKPAVRIMESIRTARRFDFDTELVVRLFWAGVRPINQPVPVHYPPRVAGGVTHFKYLRDNLLLAGTHTRLCLLMLLRLWPVWKLRKRWRHDTLC